MLKNFSAVHYKRFTVRYKTNFQRTHTLNELTKSSKDAEYSWCSVSCPDIGTMKESLIKDRWNYKKAIKAVQR